MEAGAEACQDKGEKEKMWGLGVGSHDGGGTSYGGTVRLQYAHWTWTWYEVQLYCTKYRSGVLPLVRVQGT